MSKIFLTNSFGKRYYIDSESYKIYYGIKTEATSTNKSLGMLSSIPAFSGLAASLLELKFGRGSILSLNTSRIGVNAVIVFMLFLVTAFATIVVHHFQIKSIEKANSSTHYVQASLSIIEERNLVIRGLDLEKSLIRIKLSVASFTLVSAIGYVLTSFFLWLMILGLLLLFSSLIFGDTNHSVRRKIMKDYMNRREVRRY